MLKKSLTKNVYDCRADDLLNVVADVKSYTDFIPFCTDVDIYDRSSTHELEQRLPAKAHKGTILLLSASIEFGAQVVCFSCLIIF